MLDMWKTHWKWKSKGSLPYNRKYRDAAHWKCNVNLKLTVIFRNLKSYDSNFITNKIGKIDVKVDVIPNGLKNYIAL